jgi:hypothetical protein
MSSAARAPRPSLSATVLRIAAVALIVATLIWALLFADVVRTRADSGAQPAAPVAGPDGGRSPAPAPVTTRTS